MSLSPPSLTVGPSDPALDTLLRIRTSGPEAGAIVTISTTQVDPGGDRWQASASFVADEHGVVDTTSDAPLAGSYEGFDAMGLVWSMTRQHGSMDGPGADRLGPVRLTVRARCGDGPTAVASVARACRPDGLLRTALVAPGVVGVLFRPEDGGPYPGVMLLGGSEGGLREVDAALLAAHGFSVLALAYVGVDGVPDDLVDLPLESFDVAIDLLLAQPGVRGERIGVVGGSRGGQAALLIGTLFPRVAVVVSTVGSGVVMAGMRPAATLLESLRADVGSWTWRGRRIPHMRCTVGQDLIDQVNAGVPVELARAFRPDLVSRREVTAATIPVERIRGPVLLLSAADDRGWPSAALSDIALQRLERHAHGFPFQHVSYPDAGHVIASAPYRPAELDVPVQDVRLAMGGTIPGTAAARADAWQRTIEWLAEHLPA